MGLCDVSSFYGPYFSHFGMIKVIDFGHTVDIHWDIHNTEPEAMNALCDYLLMMAFADKRRCRIALKFFFGAWNTELYDSPEFGLDRINLLNEHQKINPKKDIIIANLDLSNITSSHSHLKNSLDFWNKSNGVLDSCINPEFDNCLEHSLLYNMEPTSKQFVYNRIGVLSLTAALLGDSWRYQSVGKSPTNCASDDIYEAFVCSDYEAVMESGAPKLDHIHSYYQVKGDDPRAKY
jgi:hypothetical protein